MYEYFYSALFMFGLGSLVLALVIYFSYKFSKFTTVLNILLLSPFIFYISVYEDVYSLVFFMSPFIFVMLYLAKKLNTKESEKDSEEDRGN